MRSIIRSALLGGGVRTIYEAADGADALELAIEHHPHIILCDWIMTPVGGREFLSTLRADKDAILNTTPVLIVTAHSSRATLLEAVAVGVHGFVAKPISPAVLIGRIVEVLERQAVQGRTKGIVGLEPTVIAARAASGEEADRAASVLKPVL